MAKATGYAVAKVCEAQAKLDEAANALTSARLDVIRLSGDGDGDFRGTPLDQLMNRFGGTLTELAYLLDPMIRDVAALIESPDPATPQQGSLASTDQPTTFPANAERGVRGDG